MLSLDQIQRELEAIRAFDKLFLAEAEHYPHEEVGFQARKLRKRELLILAGVLVSRN